MLILANYGVVGILIAVDYVSLERRTGIPCVPCFSDADLVRRIGLFIGEGHVPRISDLVETSLSTDG